MWAIANHYKDQNEDLEKYKLICRFVNPDAARKIWDEDAQDEVALNDEFLAQIQKHTKAKLSPNELSERVFNPEKYDQDIDTIERIN
jgi:hypothetical protein